MDDSTMRGIGIMSPNSLTSLVSESRPGPPANARLQRLRGQQVAIDFVVAILKENGLAPVATLRDMMRKSGNHDTSNSSHTWTIALCGE